VDEPSIRGIGDFGKHMLEVNCGALLDVMLPDPYYLTIKNDSSAILSSGQGSLDSGNN
jgi:hypothetical protein